MAYKCQDALHRRTRTRAAYASADADADGCDFALEAFPYADAPLRHLRIRVWRWSSPSPIAGAHLLASSFPYPAAARCLLAWLLLLAPLGSGRPHPFLSFPSRVRDNEYRNRHRHPPSRRHHDRYCYRYPRRHWPPSSSLSALPADRPATTPRHAAVCLRMCTCV